MTKKLAKVKEASLEIKEREILNFWIFVDYEEGGTQGIGGIALDSWSEGKKKRIGTIFGCEIIRQLLLCLDVDDFSEMKNKSIWVLGEGDFFNFKPKGIQSLAVDGKQKTVIFDEVLKEFSQN